jgi:hypothetical protein
MFHPCELPLSERVLAALIDSREHCATHSLMEGGMHSMPRNLGTLSNLHLDERCRHHWYADRAPLDLISLFYEEFRFSR